MARVKMNAKHEYEFIANFKILQNIFRAHKVEKVRPYHHTLARVIFRSCDCVANSCR